MRPKIGRTSDAHGREKCATAFHVGIVHNGAVTLEKDRLPNNDGPSSVDSKEFSEHEIIAH